MGGEFKMEHIFENVDRMKPNDKLHSEKENYLNCWWRIQITRCNDDFKVGMCSRRRSGQESRKLQADLDMIISSGSDNRMTARLNDAVFEPSAGYCSQGKDIFKWGSVVDFLADGCLKVEVRVNITGSVVAPPISNGMDEFRQERYVNVRSFIDKYAPDKRSETIKQQLPNNITQNSPKNSSIKSVRFSPTPSQFARSYSFRKRVTALESEKNSVSSEIESIADMVKQLSLINDSMARETEQIAKVNVRQEGIRQARRQDESSPSFKKSEPLLSPPTTAKANFGREGTRQVRRQDDTTPGITKSEPISPLGHGSIMQARRLEEVWKHPPRRPKAYQLDQSPPEHQADLLKFLEVRYEKSIVTDANVDLLLQFAIRKSDLVVLDKCETFLMLKSRKSISELLKIAMEFSLEALKIHCLSKITTLDQVTSVISDLTLSGLDRSLLEALMSRTLKLK
ncbi:MATH domain-containing protein [Caenorhabditis elegans]|uniref:MATH domain-containing protein n=1 Tax=Caenorhabditis elegans TaxID=6239 RepID=O44870_CAEEL|nr:MATH domain-containing protein [Caenorhabditis elegans]CCD72682.1 MATH domain-containing protein [Caenorhabditis elegans]|eukprot:NP_494000.2 Uncharacterized protein CELE_K05F6.10 [Caenorhabditis elegans]